ncbi:unnamed protein product [Discosporangium mesarthrocarpum]
MLFSRAIDSAIVEVQLNSLAEAVNAATLYVGRLGRGRSSLTEGGGCAAGGDPLSMEKSLIAQQHKLLRILSCNGHNGEGVAVASIMAHLERCEGRHGTGAVLSLGLLDVLSLLSWPFRPKGTGEVHRLLYDHLGKGGILRRYGAKSTLDCYPPTISPGQMEEVIGMPSPELSPITWPMVAWLLTLGVAMTGFIGAGLEVDPNRTWIAWCTMVFLVIDKELLRGSLFQLLVYTVFPKLRERAVVHEAGHFLMAYLLGCPVSSYYISGFDSMLRGGAAGGGGSTVFHDQELTATLQSVSEGLADITNMGEGMAQWISGGWDENDGEEAAEEVNKQGERVSAAKGMGEGRHQGKARHGIGPFALGNRHAMVLMGGVAAEMVVFGDARGGAHDAVNLQKVLASLYPTAKEAELENTARWALLAAMQILRSERRILDRLTEAMRNGQGVGHCLMEIEQA